MPPDEVEEGNSWLPLPKCCPVAEAEICAASALRFREPQSNSCASHRAGAGIEREGQGSDSGRSEEAFPI